MEKQLTVREWRDMYNNCWNNEIKELKYDLKNWWLSHDAKKHASCLASKMGWYDWFCKTESLPNRTIKFGKLVNKITNDYVLDNMYIWFKNNCPVFDPTYDDIRFEPINRELRDKDYFGVAVDDKQGKNKYELFTARDGYQVIFWCKNINDVASFINNLKF